MKNEFLYSVLSGSVGGLVSALLVGFFILVFRKILIPWYRSYVYQGTKIDGTWEYDITYASKNVSKVTLKLSQSTYNVIADIIEHKTFPDGRPPVQTISKYKGRYIDRLLTLNGRELKNEDLGTGVYLLEFVSNDKLSGIYGRRCKTEKHILCNNIDVKRVT